MQNRIFSLPLISFLVALAGQVSAEPGVVISIESIAKRVQEDNPDLAAAHYQIHEAVGRMTQSGRLSNPEVSAGFNHNPRFRERGLELGISQKFPVTARLRLEKQVTATLVQAAEKEVRDIERRLVAEARLAVINTLSIRQRRNLLSQQSTVAQEFSTHLSDAAQRGEGSALDAGLAKLEAATLVTQMRQLDAAEASSIGVLKPLLGLPPQTPIHVVGELRAPKLPTVLVNPEKRPDYQAAKLTSEAAWQNVALEQAKRHADVEAGVVASVERTEDAPEGYDRDAFVGLRFKIPLPLWDKNEGRIAEAEAKHERTRREAVALGRSIRLEAESTRSEMEQWAKLVRELESELMPQAEEQSGITEEAFRKGQGDIQSVFRSREKRLQLAGARLDALREFHLARVRHEAALGQP